MQGPHERPTVCLNVRPNGGLKKFTLTMLTEVISCVKTAYIPNHVSACVVVKTLVTTSKLEIEQQLSSLNTQAAQLSAEFQTACYSNLLSWFNKFSYYRSLRQRTL